MKKNMGFHAPSSIVRWAVLSAVLASSACGVEFLKPLTPDQMASYPDVIAMAKDRYTGTRIAGPLNLSQWSTSASETRQIASFQVPTNLAGADADYQGLVRDFTAYCTYRGGRYEDFGTASAQRWQALRQQYSDPQSVNAGMGNPPNFGCTTPAGALFVGQALRVPGAGSAATILVRINEGKSAAPIPYSDYPQVE